MHAEFMRRALELARRAEGRTSPNPMVGAVIVRDGRIVGQGWHRQAGTPHAEVNALRDAGEAARGATVYVTLEPCNHHGRTGPCTEALIGAGVRRVVAAMTDPNPRVAGTGLKRLREAGIEVEEGLLAAEAARLNEAFLKWITTRMPFGVLKTAVTLDGKIATSAGHSRWITGEEARCEVHRLRNRCDAILAGIGTVLADNPELTVRMIPDGRNPQRVIIDSQARTPLTAKVVTDNAAPTVIAVAADAPRERVMALAALGADILTVPYGPGGLDLRELFRLLGARGILSILIEGGAAVNASVLATNLVDKVYWFVAPKMIGGSAAPGPVGGDGVPRLEGAYGLEDMDAVFVGRDILITGYLSGREGRDVYRSCGRIG